MIPYLLLVVSLLLGRTFVSALLLHHQNSNVNVLAFGDSWVSKGPSWLMLVDMFAFHGVAATVRSVAETGTRACQWAKVPNNLAKAAEKFFPSKGPDFVWYSLGVNDLKDKDFITCTQATADNLEASLNCMRQKTMEINSCTKTLLSNLWEIYPNTKVLQCGYDLPCGMHECHPRYQKRQYCGYNQTCLNEFIVHWQGMLLHQEDPRYTGINILGALQVAAKVEGAQIGHPRLDEDSPCNLMTECGHVMYQGFGSNFIGEVFWDLYFHGLVKSSVSPHFRPSTVFVDIVQVDTEQSDILCRWDWVPNIENWTLPPKCSD